jgi:hypothetical protein
MLQAAPLMPQLRRAQTSDCSSPTAACCHINGTRLAAQTLNDSNFCCNATLAISPVSACLLLRPLLLLLHKALQGSNQCI